MSKVEESIKQWAEEAIRRGIIFQVDPTLTPELIEAEGWDRFNDELANTHSKKVLNSSFRLKYNNTILKIMSFNWEQGTWIGRVVFEGKCEDINTFRYICKLLDI